MSVKFTDNRRRKVVFVSSCILNQNIRTFGAATYPGSFKQLVQIFFDNNIGIEQLPCPESLFWGGVSRVDLYRGLFWVTKAIKWGVFPVAEFFINLKLNKTHRQCRRLARKSIDRMEEYLGLDFKVLGIVGVDDSWTCGVDTCVDLVGVIRNREALGISIEDLESPQINVIRQITKKCRIPGSGYWIKTLIDELKCRGREVKSVGYDPWAEDPQAEAQRVAQVLGLEGS